MDQNPPQGEGDGTRVPPTEPESAQASPWGQPTDSGQAASQAAAGATDQEAAAEYAAWSSDASYQNPDTTGQPTAPADAGAAYAAPEPPAVTYQEQPPQDQPTGYDPQQQQQPPAYDQQAYQQPAYDQQAYEQQYAQQQAAYQQQQQAYEQYQQQLQQQGYDPAQYQQQGYDPSQYGQQGYGYYQQPPPGYQQQQYQQPAQPYAYAQPSQQGWPADPNYWEQGATGYGRSFIAVLAGFVLMTWGVLLTVGGAMLLFLDNVSDVAPSGLSPETQQLIDDAVQEQTAVGGIMAILGIAMVIGAVGIWAHRRWGRAFGIVLGLLGTLLGIGMVLSSVAFEVGDVSVQGVFDGEAEALGAALVVFFTFLLVFLAMFVGRRHFRKRGVAPA